MMTHRITSVSAVGASYVLFLIFNMTHSIAAARTACSKVIVRSAKVQPGCPFSQWDESKRSFVRVILDRNKARKINKQTVRAQRLLSHYLSDKRLNKKGLGSFCQIQEVLLDPSSISRSGDEIHIDPFSLHYRHELLAVFVHEQIHAIIHSPKNERHAALIIEQLKSEFPSLHDDLLAGKVPGVHKKNLPCVSFDEETENRRCTYEHLLVNLIELKALRQLLPRAKDSLYKRFIADHGIYAGIYEFLLEGKASYVENLLIQSPLTFEEAFRK